MEKDTTLKPLGNIISHGGNISSEFNLQDMGNFIFLSDTELKIYMLKKFKEMDENVVKQKKSVSNIGQL